MHPPLGKMLVGLAGALSGFNGSFDFPSGVTYPDHVPFHAMRIMLALPGVAMVPLAWGTAVELRFSKWGRHIVTVMVLTGAAVVLVSLSSPLDFPVPDFGGATLIFLLGLGTRADLAWLAISRFILLDSLLLFFTFTTVYCLACFNNQQRRSVCRIWAPYAFYSTSLRARRAGMDGLRGCED